MLKQACAKSLCAKVTTESVVKLFMLADNHHERELKTTCIEYIRAHIIEVMASEDWPLLDPKVVSEMFRKQLNSRVTQQEDARRQTGKRTPKRRRDQ